MKRKNTKTIALSHVNKLYDLAKKSFPNPISKRYVSLIKSYSNKHNLTLPIEMKRSFCKKCNFLLVPGKTCTVRIKPGKKPLKIVTCECGQIKRIGLK